MGSRRRMLALEKKPLRAFRRRRCISWSTVATIELGAEASQRWRTLCLQDIQSSLPVLIATNSGLLVFLPGPGYSVSRNSGSSKWISPGLMRTIGPWISASAKLEVKISSNTNRIFCVVHLSGESIGRLARHRSSPRTNMSTLENFNILPVKAMVLIPYQLTWVLECSRVEIKILRTGNQQRSPVNWGRTTYIGRTQGKFHEQWWL